MKRFFCVLFVVFLACAISFAQSLNEDNGVQAGQENKTNSNYVASTSWVAAIAELAGLDNVVTIAPANLKHPPEYEITADDMVSVINAKLFMHAGYEKMMKTISNAAQLDESRIVKVKTTNTLANLEKMVNMLSEKAGTEEIAQERFGEYRKLIEEARERIAASPNKDLEVFANVNQAEFARDLGLNVVSTFGSGSLTADQIKEAHEKAYALVIDNVHSPVASPISDVSPTSVILTWRNFPDYLGSNALYNVIKENLEKLWETGLF